jgi:hypothetical protein
VTEPLYIYVPNWEDHQPRADRPNLPWLRLHTKLLGSPAWLNLSCPDRVLLISVWMLIQRYGNGALLADEQWIKGQAKAHKSSLERLVQAGFLTLSTTKAQPNGGLEERRGTTSLKKREEENARAAHAVNGGARAQKKIKCPEHNAELISTAGGSGWVCPAPACRFRSDSRWVGGDPIAPILPELGRL